MSFNSVEVLIGRLIEKAPATKVQVEKALGVELREKKSGSAFIFYEGVLSAKDGTIITIDFREPYSARATVGASLAFEFQGPCYKKDAVHSRFGPVKLTDIPSGHGENENFYYTKILQWGELSFGYAEKTPNCLNDVVFSYNKT